MSVLFDDANPDYLTLSSVPDATPEFAMLCHMNFDTVSDTGIAMSVGDASVNNQHWHILQLRTGSRIRAASKDTVFATAQTATGMVVDTWHQAAATFTSATARAAFFDGANKATNTTSISPTNIDTAYIGALVNTGGVDGAFSGYIAGPCWLDTVPSDAQIVEHGLGFCPTLLFLKELVYYAPMEHDFEDEIGGVTVSSTGTPAIDNEHPNIIKPTGQVLIFPSSAPPVSATLSVFRQHYVNQGIQ